MSKVSTNISNRNDTGVKVRLEDSASTYAEGVYNLTIKCNHVGEVLVGVSDANTRSVYAFISGDVIPVPKMQTSLTVKREGEKITVNSTINNIAAAEDLSLTVIIPRRRFVNIYLYCDNADEVYCSDVDVDGLKVFSKSGEISVDANSFANRYYLLTHNKAIKMKGKCGRDLKVGNIDGDIIINSVATSDLRVDAFTENGNVKAEFKIISSSNVKVSSREGKVDEETNPVEPGYKITGEITSVNGDIEYKV